MDQNRVSSLPFQEEGQRGYTRSKYGPVFMVKVADSLAFDSKLFTKSDFQSGVNYSIHLFFHVGKFH